MDVVGDTLLKQQALLTITSLPSIIARLREDIGVIANARNGMASSKKRTPPKARRKEEDRTAPRRRKHLSMKRLKKKSSSSSASLGKSNASNSASDAPTSLSPTKTYSL